MKKSYHIKSFLEYLYNNRYIDKSLYSILLLKNEKDIKLELENSVKPIKKLNLLYNDFIVENCKKSRFEVKLDSKMKSGDTEVELVHESPVVRFIDDLLKDAVLKKCSDIHIEPYENFIAIKYRLDGVLITKDETVSKNLLNQIISRLKIMSKLDTTDSFRPQDGRFKKRFNNKDIDFRISFLYSSFGQTAVIRILDSSAYRFSLENIGINNENLNVVLKNIYKPYGMILASGPTGSGKTTTLYSLISKINKKEDKIITIEDPIEYQMSDIVQIPVDHKKKMTFASGLRAIVRQDPDKIMVGEIRDEETAQIAINSALTGHLLFSSIHSNNVFDSITRMLNMSIKHYQFASSFNIIISQRLVRKLCDSCKKKSEKIEKDKFLNIDFNDLKDSEIYEPVGCDICNFTGYKGRTGIFEVLEIDSEIKHMITEKKTAFDIEKYCKENGFITMYEDGISKVKSGITSLYELNRNTYRI